MPEPKESMSFYKNRALAAKREGGHITGDYDIESDTTEDGKRVIVLRERDLKPHRDNVNRLVDVILEQLGETESKTLRALLQDALIDYKEEGITRMLNKIEKQKQPVKTKEGCFKIVIGDGRKRSREAIWLGPGR